MIGKQQLSNLKKFGFSTCFRSDRWKAFRVECPKLTGTLCNNYKGFFSIVLLAVYDADYCFTFFDFGSNGSNKYCGVLSSSLLGEGLETKAFNIPGDEPLDGCKFTPLPHFLLEDNIFPFKKLLIKPCPGRNLSEEQKIYNYCLFPARRFIEHVFSILEARWKIFHWPIQATVERVELYVVAGLALHNCLRLISNAIYTPIGFVDSEGGDGSIYLGEWRNRDIS